MTLYINGQKKFQTGALRLIPEDLLDVIVVNGSLDLNNSSRSYDLRANFKTVNKAFAHGRILNIDSDGIQSGSLTVVDTSTGTVKVVGNELEITGTGTWDETGVYSPDAVTRALGKALFMTWTESNDNTYLGFNSAESVSINTVLGHRMSSDDIYTNKTGAIGHGGGNETKVVDNFTPGSTHQYLFLLGGYDASEIPFITGDTVADFTRGAAFFIKGGDFTTWTLLWKVSTDNTTPLYPMLQNQTATGNLGDNILIPTLPLNVDTMFNPAYLSTSPDESDHDTGISDFVMEVVFTTPGSGTDPLDIRYRKAGTNDYWLVRITPGTLGTDIEIIEDNSGEVQRASADIDWATTTEYRIAIHVRGDSEQRVYVDGALKMTYTTTNTFNETETIIDVLKNSFTVSMVAVHNKTDSNWDTEISAATGGIY